MDYSKDLTKRIDIEQKFADFIYKEFRSKRFGMAPCCSIDQMDKYKIKKELCDWYDRSIKTYSTIYEQKSFYPIPENNPDLFASEDETITTTTPIVTSYETILVAGEPIWVVADCINNCVYPPKFIPTSTQLKNENVDPSGETEAVAGVGILEMNNGRNGMFKFYQGDLEWIPNNNNYCQGCAGSEVTIYSKIDFLAYMQEIANNTDIQNILDGYSDAYLGNTPDGAVTLAAYDWYSSGFETNSFIFDNINMPPKSAWQEYENTGSSFYWVPMAQFTLLTANAAGIGNLGGTSVKIAFKYLDPTLQSDNFGNNIFTTIDIDGITYYTGDNDDFAGVTFFGNELLFKKNLGNQSNWYNINGGFYYPDAQSSGDAMMRAVVVDGTDVYQTDFTLSDGEVVETGMPNPGIYYSTSPNVGGSFLNSEYVINGGEQVSYDSFYVWKPLVINGNFDLSKPSCSFQWGVGTTTTGENIGLNGNEIEEGILDSECKYEGIETYEKEIVKVTTGGDTITETVTVFSCKNDNEYLLFKVEDSNGNLVEDYEIILDGGNIGKTDKTGTLKTIIENASINTKHTLNICHCFTTTGACTQKEIKIIINDDSTTNISINKADCTDISSSE